VTERMSLSSGGVEGNFYSLSPSISADGRGVAFTSYATNLVLGDTNGIRDVFVRFDYGLIFSDGFELGNTNAWDSTLP
jgi:hypothetical protein